MISQAVLHVLAERLRSRVYTDALFNLLNFALELQPHPAWPQPEYWPDEDCSDEDPEHPVHDESTIVSRADGTTDFASPPSADADNVQNPDYDPWGCLREWTLQQQQRLQSIVHTRALSPGERLRKKRDLKVVRDFDLALKFANRPGPDVLEFRAHWLAARLEAGAVPPDVLGKILGELIVDGPDYAVADPDRAMWRGTIAVCFPALLAVLWPFGFGVRISNLHVCWPRWLEAIPLEVPDATSLHSEQMRSMAEAGFTQREIGANVGIAQSRVSSILSRAMQARDAHRAANSPVDPNPSAEAARENQSSRRRGRPTKRQITEDELIRLGDPATPNTEDPTPDRSSCILRYLEQCFQLTQNGQEFNLWRGPSLRERLALGAQDEEEDNEEEPQTDADETSPAGRTTPTGESVRDEPILPHWGRRLCDPMFTLPIIARLEASIPELVSSVLGPDRAWVAALRCHLTGGPVPESLGDRAPWVSRARTLINKLGNGLPPADCPIFAAYQLLTTSPMTCAMLDACLLAGVSHSRIATLGRMPVEVVTAYEVMFYSLPSGPRHRGAVEYAVHHVFRTPNRTLERLMKSIAQTGEGGTLFRFLVYLVERRSNSYFQFTRPLRTPLTVIERLNFEMLIMEAFLDSSPSTQRRIRLLRGKFEKFTHRQKQGQNEDDPFAHLSDEYLEQMAKDLEPLTAILQTTMPKRTSQFSSAVPNARHSVH